MHRCSFAYIVLSIDVGPSVHEQSHHLTAVMISSCYQGSEPIILSDTDTDTFVIHVPHTFIHGGDRHGKQPTSIIHANDNDNRYGIERGL